MPEMLQPNVPAWLEIPVNDLDRAARFYEAVLAATLDAEKRRERSRIIAPPVRSRDVEPLSLAFRGGAWTLGAWCRLRAGFRDFRVDRMVDLWPTGETFPDDPARGLAAYFAEMVLDAESFV
jgi:predicted DNA-binding transcriptional regulator YafY